MFMQPCWVVLFSLIMVVEFWLTKYSMRTNRQQTTRMIEWFMIGNRGQGTVATCRDAIRSLARGARSDGDGCSLPCRNRTQTCDAGERRPARGLHWG